MKQKTKIHSLIEDKDPNYNTQQSNPEVTSMNQGFPFSCCDLSQSSRRGLYIGENYMDQGKVQAEESLGKHKVKLCLLILLSVLCNIVSIWMIVKKALIPHIAIALLPALISELHIQTREKMQAELIVIHKPFIHNLFVITTFSTLILTCVTLFVLVLFGYKLF